MRNRQLALSYRQRATGNMQDLCHPRRDGLTVSEFYKNHIKSTYYIN
jgi:hypothetical protein